MSAFRVGFITDGLLINKLYRDVMDWVVAQPDMEVGAIIVQNCGPPASTAQALAHTLRRRGIGGVIAQIAFSLLYKAELALEPRCAPLLEERDYGEISAPRLNVAPNVSKSGLVYRYSHADLERIADLNLDVLVRCGSGILKGEILTAAKHGIVSLHHGDNRVNRGGPPGFWEVVRREPTSGFIVQRLGEEVDGGAVLARGSIRTRSSFVKNRAALYELSTAYLTRTLRSLPDGRATAEPPHIYHQPLFRQPGVGEIAGYAGKRLAWVLGIVAGKATRRNVEWSVAYLKGDWRSAVLWRGKLLPKPRGTFVADPFVVERERRTVVFVEEFIYAQRRAAIAAYEIKGGSAERLGLAVDEPFHLSYPFVFEMGDELFMCPESANRRQIRLYRCVKFPLRWELDTVLMDGVNAVDTNIFEHDGRWWMLTSIQDGLDDCATTLNAFYANSPRGPWTPHAANPLTSDVTSARNGGFVRDGSTIYRFSQSANFGEYGTGLRLNRIDRLDPENYAETAIQFIGAEFMHKARGIHHLNASRNFVVFDFWRPRYGDRFTPSA